MLSPKYQRLEDRLSSLIKEGQDLPREEITQSVPSSYAAASLTGGPRYPPPTTHTSTRIVDDAALAGWYVKSENLLQNVFGETSPHLTAFRSYGNKDDTHINVLDKRIGVLNGALDDLQNGFLNGQELIIAADIFDSVLEQAKHLRTTGYKDVAAVLGRVIIEDAIRRLASQNSIEHTSKAAVVNLGLKTAGVYNQPQWRQVEVWLDIGNKAAHGKFTEYTDQQVGDMLDGIESFLAGHFS